MIENSKSSKVELVHDLVLIAVVIVFAILAETVICLTSKKFLSRIWSSIVIAALSLTISYVLLFLFDTMTK